MSVIAHQPSFDDLGTHLAAATFVVVDLETTGGSADSSITEIGAVKVCGGEIVGEFQTLVRPAGPIPAMIQVLTGITNDMVAGAPRIGEVLPRFADFARGCVLVAHNARFDMGFLRRGYDEIGLQWGRPAVVDTVALARQALLKDEVRNCKLSTLAEYFHATTVPNHRALSDARATVDVLHALLERVGNMGVRTLEDLTEFLSRVAPERRAKRVWANALPERPGIYWFEHEGADSDGRPRTEVLYVGKSRNLRRRVRTYFTAAEQRSRIHEMVRVATGVEFLECATDLEAEVRELRMIEGRSPRYNRRSKAQTKLTWLRLTNEPFPRLSAVRSTTEAGVHYWGPFTSAESAQNAMLVLQDAFGIRQCTKRLSARTPSAACALAEMGRCLAPCRLGADGQGYAAAVESTARAFAADPRPVLRASRERLARLVREERFEEAAEITERLRAFYRTSLRHHRIRSIALCAQLVAAAPGRDGWDVHVIRHGRLVASGTAETRAVREVADELRVRAETVATPSPGIPAGTVEEAERIAAWLETPGLRLLSTEGDWAWPIHVGVGEDALPAELLGDEGVIASDFSFPDEVWPEPRRTHPSALLAS